MRSLINIVIFISGIIQLFFFLVLTVPMPSGYKNKLLKFLAESKLIKKIYSAQIFNLILVGLVFIEAIFKERVYHEEVAGKAVKNLLALDNMFLFQRNVYMSGICLFLMLANYRTAKFLRIYKQKKEELTALKGQKLDDKKVEQKEEKKAEKVKLDNSTAQPLDDASYQKQKDSKLKKND